MTTPGTSQASPAVQEFKIRVPKNVKKKHHVMRFNATLNVDFAKWTQVKMERENNIKEFKGLDEDMPKFGAGSEYGRDIREEARRKKFGIISRKYKPEDQPWILKVGGKTGKKFKGIREGGVSENAAYYVFTHAADSAIDAYPLQEWYNFQPIQRYKALSAEEAEQEFGRRNKVINYFSLMFRKRMRGDDAADDGEDPDDKKTKGAKAKKELKISDMDEWIDSDDDSSGSEAAEKDNDSDSGAKKKPNKKGPVKKKKKVEDEAFEESDDGDEEGRERDYISDSSDSETDHEAKANKELKGVAEEDALRKLLTSDEDSEEEQEQKEASEPEDEPTREGEERASKLTKKRRADDKHHSSSELSEDSDTDAEAPPKKPKKRKEPAAAPTPSSASAPGSASTSRSGSPAPAAAAAAAAHAAAAAAAANAPPAKRPKIDPSYTECGVTEEAVRRYLARKPMTTTELLTKFKSKLTGVSSERLLETMTQILKRINPVKQNINGKMYLSIKNN
ncbi:general transcription factor IIF subunit 1 isoform X2 [Leguminivora glycinivorella]|uniref:general transcription factor IIF subunit 1 isoform X2 n=1 Tax=Leguminivora glycinivorella TaxID=1035111 RepID=UPI00200E94B2|nr:general transcription factor IIF subunit 1 isoform X2 [Leguminivora glycinivorella]